MKILGIFNLKRYSVQTIKNVFANIEEVLFMCRLECKLELAAQNTIALQIIVVLLYYLLTYKNRSSLYRPYLWVADAYVYKDTRGSI